MEPADNLQLLQCSNGFILKGVHFLDPSGGLGEVLKVVFSHQSPDAARVLNTVPLGA